MSNYRTSQIAKIIKIHPNTVRLYEELGFVTPAKRLLNGYRVFEDTHITQFTLARLALSMDKKHKTIRKIAILTVKSSAKNDMDRAFLLMGDLIKDIHNEKENAEQIKVLKKVVITGKNEQVNKLYLTRKQAAEYVNSTTESLRNWEKSNVIIVKRKLNNYRVYLDEDIEKLRIIMILKGLGYSLEDIKNQLEILSYELDQEDISVYGQSTYFIKILELCDRYLVEMEKAETTANLMYELLHILTRDYRR